MFVKSVPVFVNIVMESSAFKCRTLVSGFDWRCAFDAGCLVDGENQHKIIKFSYKSCEVFQRQRHIYTANLYSNVYAIVSQSE